MRLITTFALVALIGLSLPVMGQSLSDFDDAIAASDYDAAFEIAEALAKQGNASAQHNLGVMYSRGDGVAQNISKAAKWHQLAAEQGVIESQVYLGIMYDEGTGVVQNYSKAEEWYSLASERGDPHAQSLLGWMYELGNGVEKNLTIAYVLYSLSASQGHEDARKNRDRVLERLSSGEIAEAQRVASEWEVGTPLPKPRDINTR